MIHLNNMIVYRRYALASVMASLCVCTSGYAETFSVFSPKVEEGEVSMEFRYARVMEGEDDEVDGSAAAVALEWGFAEKWRLELVGEYEHEKDESWEFEGVELELVRNLTEQGEDGANISSALVVALTRPRESDAPDVIEYGFYLEKGFGESESGESEDARYATNVLANLKFSNQFGDNAETGVEFEYGLQVKWALGEEFAAGIEMFGELGKLTDAESFNDQEHLAGPVLFGELELGEGTEIGYEIGYLFGLSDAAADGVAKINLEVEF